jgi:hypothetical protein
MHSSDADGLPTLQFGKHRGKRLDAVPPAYLRWMHRACTDLDPALRRAVKQELARRRADAGEQGPSGRSREVVGRLRARLVERLKAGADGAGEYGAGAVIDQLLVALGRALQAMEMKAAAGEAADPAAFAAAWALLADLADGVERLRRPGGAAGLYGWLAAAGPGGRDN